MKRVLVSVLFLILGLGVGYWWHSVRVLPKPGEFYPPRRVVDLSVTITEDLAVRHVGARTAQAFGYPTRTRFRRLLIDQPNFYAASSIYELINHIGTHFDPASHLIKRGLTADNYPLSKFIGRARLLDFRGKARDAALTVEDLQPHARDIQAGDIVILFTGYQPPTRDDDWPSYPYLSGEAAEWLAQRGIKAFASDMPSLGSIRRYPDLMLTAKAAGEVTPEHMAFLTREIPNIEGLTNLEALVGETNIVFIGFPLKVKDADGGLLRAVALVY